MCPTPTASAHLPDGLILVVEDEVIVARDIQQQLCERGYTLVAAGAMDMFPQTAHVESIALFEK